MGIFSDTCQGLIDPQTNRVLTGPALKDAESDPSWPRCGHKVKKAARFCSTCGAGAPGGWRKCPTCAKWVGNDSRFCWNCKTELRPEERDQFAAGVWRKPPEVFAQRFEVGDLDHELKRGLRVQAGTVALMLDGGKPKGRLEAGEHDVEGLLRTINHWGSPPPRSAVLVDVGDAVLPIRFEDLRTAEDLPVEFYGELVFAFDEKRIGHFLANCLKQGRTVTYADILEALEGDLRHAVAAMCDASTIEDLVKDPERRLRLDALVEDAAGKALDRLGLKLVRTASAEFVSDEYETLRRQSGELETKRREIEFTQRLRELLNSDRMHAFKDEHELAEYVAQLAQESGVGEAKREHELDLLRQVQAQALDANRADFMMAEEMKRATHEIGVKIRWDGYSREKSLADAQVESQIYTIKVDREIDETEKWLRIRKLKEQLKRDDLAEKAKIFDGKSVETLIMLEEDAGKRRDLLEVQRRQQQAGMGVEQILASLADSSPEAARTLAGMNVSSREDLEREFAERKTLIDEHRAQTERMFNKAMDVASDASKHRGGGEVNIVK